MGWDADTLIAGVNTLMQAVVAISLFSGVLIARRQLNQNRREKLQTKRVEIALEIVEIMTTISRSVVQARMVFSNEPNEMSKQEKLEHLERRIEIISGVEPMVDRARLLSEYQSGLSVGVEVSSDLQDYLSMVQELFWSMSQLMEYLRSEKEPDDLEKSQRLAEADSVAFSPRYSFGEDIFGHNHRVLNRKIINAMMSFVRAESMT